MALYIELFLVFVRIGFSSFGGLSMLPIINQEMLSHNWMTLSEVSDIVAIAEMTPGPLGLNCATFVGMRTGGVLGALVSTFGVLIPSLTLCFVVAIFIQKVKGNRRLADTMYGIRPICIGLIIYTLLTLCYNNFIVANTISWPPILICGIISIISWKFKLSVPVLIIIAGILGLILA